MYKVTPTPDQPTSIVLRVYLPFAKMDWYLIGRDARYSLLHILTPAMSGWVTLQH